MPIVTLHGVLLECLPLMAHNHTGMYAPPTVAKKTDSINGDERVLRVESNLHALKIFHHIVTFVFL